MFFDRLTDEMLQKGFDRVSFQQQGFVGFIKRGTEYNSCVIFVNLPNQLPENIWNIRYSTEQIKSEVREAGVTNFLFVYLTEEPEKIKCLCDDAVDSHWIMDRNELRLIIYENQNDNYCSVKEVVEHVLTEKNDKRRFKPWVTAAIIGVNVIVYVILYLFCNETLRESLIDKGGLYWPSVIYDHEYYRLITSVFIHSGFQHLLNNMILLCFIGSYVEEYIGRGKFAFLYFTTGILAGAVSMSYNILNEKMILSIGASGAIFGIVGALTCFIVVSRRMIRDITAPRLLIFIFLSIFSGLHEQGIDNMAHIGGLLSGILLAIPFALIKRKKEKKAIQR